MNGAVRTSLVTVVSLLLSIADAQGTTTLTPTVKQTATSTLSCDRFHKTGFWDVDIDNWPALAPECGPPLSINALRDKSKLPAQICGVVGSYIFCVLLVGSLILTLGRRMRRGAERSPATLEIEMVNGQKSFEPTSPVGSQRSWINKGLNRLKVSSSANSKASSIPNSPMQISGPGAHASVASFDSKHFQDTKQAQQLEMERLYAAVMVHDEQKRASELRLSQAPTMRSAHSNLGIESSPPKPMGEKGKLRLQISEHSQEFAPQQFAPKSPYKAIYPSPGGFSGMSGQSPMSPMAPMTPMSPGMPQRIELPNDMYPASPPPQARQMQLPAFKAEEQPPPTPRSFLHRQQPRDDSSSSSSSKSRKSRTVKSLRISGPVTRPGPDDLEESEPLTPRYPIPLNPPPPPGLPEQRQVHFSEGHQRIPSNGPLTGQSVQSFQTIESDTYAAERMDEPKPLPLPQLPLRRPSNLNLSLPSSPGANKPASSSTNSLPFRAFQNASASDISSSSNPLSPGPMKTTFLERKIEKHRGPLTARTPRTGVPMTPFSPYMPFTPITPVTPGLVSRQARKERIKAEGRKVLVEEDVVKDSDEMWDAGY